MDTPLLCIKFFLHVIDSFVQSNRKSLASEMRLGRGERPMSIMDIRRLILDESDIVCCTLSGAGSQSLIEVVFRLTGFKFDAVIMGKWHEYCTVED